MYWFGLLVPTHSWNLFIPRSVVLQKTVSYLRVGKGGGVVAPSPTVRPDPKANQKECLGSPLESALGSVTNARRNNGERSTTNSISFQQHPCIWFVQIWLHSPYAL